MKKAKIGQLRNHLSRYLDHVRAGGEVLVLDRNEPVARLVPVRPRARAGTDPTSDAARLDRLERQGLIRRGRPGGPPLGQPIRVKGGVLRLLREERESGW